MAKNKEFLYVGYYIDTEKHFILKIGTTNNLARRQKEHTSNYRKAKTFTMPIDKEFQYLWHLPLSKYNTLRYEDRNREEWKNLQIGDFVRNDRFVLHERPPSVPIRIKKTYYVNLALCEM